MAQVLIRGISDEMLKVLKEQARKEHRSLQGQLKKVLEEAVDYYEKWERDDEDMARIRERIGPRPGLDITKLIREHRDS